MKRKSLLIFIVVLSSYINILSARVKTLTIGSVTEFYEVLDKAQNQDTIVLKGGIVYDLSDYGTININKSLVVKGEDNSKEGKVRITYKKHGVNPLFNIVSNDVKIENLILEGPDGDVYHDGINYFEGIDVKKISTEERKKIFQKNTYSTPVSAAISINSSNVSINNCEIFNWTYAGIRVNKGARNASVHGNLIYKNRRYGLGYGVVVDQGEVLIFNNDFRNNGHSIASTGRVGSIYVVYENNFYNDESRSWSIDMHSGKDRGEDNIIAGTRFEIYNNTFYLQGNTKAVVIRGEPLENSFVYNNSVYVKNKKRALEYYFEQRFSNRKIYFRDNTLIIL